MEEIEALVVGEERIGPVLQEHVYEVIVTFLRGPEDGSSDGIAAFCVHIGAALDEEVAERIVIVNGGPLHGNGYDQYSTMEVPDIDSYM